MQGSKSRTSRGSSGRSAVGMYGGFDTIRSNDPSRSVVQSPTQISALSDRPRASRLPSATIAASAEISTPTPRALANSVRRAHSNAPEPTPRSRIRNGLSRRSLNSRSQLQQLLPFRVADPTRAEKSRATDPRIRVCRRSSTGARRPPAALRTLELLKPQTRAVPAVRR